MKTIKQKSHKTSLFFLLGALILLLAIGSFAWFYYLQSGSNTLIPEERTDTSVNPTPNRLNSEDAKAKQEFIENNNLKNSSSNTNNETQRPTDKPIEVSAKQESNTVTIFTKLHGFKDGKCNLSIVNGSKSHTRAVEIIYQPEYSICAGFSVPVSELGIGVWTVKIVAIDSTNNSSNTATIEVK